MYKAKDSGREECFCPISDSESMAEKGGVFARFNCRAGFFDFCFHDLSKASHSTNQVIMDHGYYGCPKRMVMVIETMTRSFLFSSEVHLEFR